MLDARDDALAGLYNTVLRFVDRDLRRLMEIAERVCVKSGSRARAGAGEEAGGFEIMANVVWAEIGRAVLDELGSVVFAAGKPDDFRKVRESLGMCWVREAHLGDFSTTRRRRRSFARSSSSRRPCTPSRLCARTPCTCSSSGAGSCRYTSSCGGKRLSVGWRKALR